MGGRLRIVSIGAAVVGPILLWAAVTAGVSGFRDARQTTAHENAGRVLNARVVRGDVVGAIDRMLAAGRPRVVVIGPSYANTNVDPARLAEHLRLDPSDVALVSVPNSVGSHWYAILKYRVLEAGYRPDLVLFVSGLQSMLLTTPLSESSFVNLRVQLPEAGDPVVDAKVRGSAELWLANLREQRGKVRGAFFDAVRDLAVFWLDPEPTQRALARVFDDAKVDMRLYGRTMPVIESGARAARGFTPDLLPTPEESFLRDTTAMATAAGVPAVWVRPPMSPHVPPEHDDVVPAGFQSRASEIVADAGGTYVDLRHLHVSARMFRNEDHMNAEGSRRFTRALAALAEERGWLAPSDVPWPVTVTGSAMIGPGERVTVAAPEPWPAEAGRFAVWLSAESVGERDTAPFTLTLDEHPVPIVRGRAVSRGDRVVQQWHARTALPAPEGPSTLTVAASRSGPGVRLRAIAFGEYGRLHYAVGDDDALHGVQLDLLGGGGGVELETPRPAARVPRARRPLVPRPDRVAAFDTARLAFLSDEALQAPVSGSAPCSPLRVAEDGVLLPFPNAPCGAVRSRGHGRTCHTREMLFLTASDGTDPARNGRDYELRLASSRACGEQVFLYPGDLLRFSVAPDRVARFDRGARFLTIRARSLQRSETELAVRLSVGEDTVLDRRFDGRRFERGPVTLRFDATVVPTGEPWVVELENLDRTFTLVEALVLSENPIRQ